MAAGETLFESARKFLPSNLASSISSTREEIDLRFLETSESFILALILDPDAPYYLTKLIIDRIVLDINTLLAATTDILNVLKSTTKKVSPPEADRHFELASESLQRIGARVSNGSAPESSDLDQFIEESRIFAQLQLVPQEQSLSQEAYKSRLFKSIEVVKTVLPDLRTRISKILPSQFFVDSLPESLRKSKQLSIFVSRMQDVLQSQQTVLKSLNVLDRVNKSQSLLEETAVAIVLAGLLNNLAFLKNRHRVAGTALPYGQGHPASLLGDPISSALGSGNSPLVSLTTGNETLVFQSDIDRDGEHFDTVSVTLPVSTKPSPIEVMDPGSGWVTEHGFQITVTIALSKDGVDEQYTSIIVPVPTYEKVSSVPSPQDKDYGYFIDSSGLVPPSPTPTYGKYNSISGNWINLGGAPTIELTSSSNRSYVDIFNDPRVITIGPGGVSGPVLSDLVNVTAVSGKLRIEVDASSLGLRDAGSDISLSISTSGTNYTPQIGLGPLIASNSTGGRFYAVGSIFEDLTGNFSLVKPGHFLKITTSSAGNNGLHRVISVISSTRVSLSGSFVDEGPGLQYEFVTHNSGNKITSTGTSPTLAQIVSQINNAAGNVAISLTYPGRRIKLSSKVSGVTSEFRGSRLKIVSQPMFGSSPVLGFGTAEVFGEASQLHDPEGRFRSSGVRPGMLIKMTPNRFLGSVDHGKVVQVIDDSTILVSPNVISDPQEVAYSIYAVGAMNYETAIGQFFSQLETAFGNLLSNTDTLSDLLGRSVFTIGDRKRAESYIRETIGDPTDDSYLGPAEVILDILSKYSAPVSSALESSLKSLSERGFDQTVDLLLLGQISQALTESNSSYSATLRRALSGLNVEGLLNGRT